MSNEKCSFCGHTKEKCLQISCPHPSWKGDTKSVEKKSKPVVPDEGEASD